VNLLGRAQTATKVPTRPFALPSVLPAPLRASARRRGCATRRRARLGSHLCASQQLALAAGSVA